MSSLSSIHPDRKEIARYLLSRGAELEPDLPQPAGLVTAGATDARTALDPVSFPDHRPQPSPISPAPGSDHALPEADVVVITWTADEADALAYVLTHGYTFRPATSGAHADGHWYPYAHNFDAFRPQIRAGGPALAAKRLASYLPITIGSKNVLCMKSELHLNQDGVATGQGRATLPVKDLFKQVIAETGASLILTIGTAGSVFDDFDLGDVVITRAARFRLQQEFRSEPFNNTTYKSAWHVPTSRLADAEALMEQYAAELAQPAVGPPSPAYPPGELVAPKASKPRIRLDGRDMPEFHPILTTDYFEYGTTTNRLDQSGAAVEMGDAALGLACSELHSPPDWLVIRNMSDPVINGDLPAKQFHLNEQTTWAVAYYTAYGKYTSVLGAIATWSVLAALS